MPPALTRALVFLLPLTFALVGAARAEEAPQGPAVGGERPPFAKGSKEWGLSLGHGNGLSIFGSDGADTADVELIGLFPRFGVGLSDPVGTDSWYHGNLELIVEGSLLAAYEPKGGFVGGVGLAFRYNLLGWERLVPFVEIGGGVGGIELDLDDQGDGLIFSAHAGLGLHWWLAERTALTASWRLHHLSNAGIGDDNAGINDSMFLVGLSYFP
jgi:hypothetical protein